jgi:hypothetical protein
MYTIIAKGEKRSFLERQVESIKREEEKILRIYD